MKDETMNTADIAAFLGLCRAYVTDQLVKRHDFPQPVIEMSQKTRRWRRADVERYVRPKRRAMASADSR